MQGIEAFFERVRLKARPAKDMRASSCCETELRALAMVAQVFGQSTR